MVLLKQSKEEAEGNMKSKCEGYQSPTFRSLVITINGHRIHVKEHLICCIQHLWLKIKFSFQEVICSLYCSKMVAAHVVQVVRQSESSTVLAFELGCYKQRLVLFLPHALFDFTPIGSHWVSNRFVTHTAQTSPSWKYDRFVCKI